MKKKNLKSLKLNKKSISTFKSEKIKGGTLGIICIAYSLANSCVGHCPPKR